MKNKIISEIRALISKVKLQDLTFGEYLEDNIVFDEQNETVLYTGNRLEEFNI